MLEFILKSLYKYITEYVPEINYIDLFKGGGIADINTGAIEGAARPVIFLELLPLVVDDMLGNKTQRFTGSVIMHLITDAYGSFPNDSDNLNLNLESVNLVDTIYKKLNGLTEISINDKEYIIGNFSRTALEFPEELGNLMDSRVTFEFVILDNSLNLTGQEAQIDNIDIEIT